MKENDSFLKSEISIALEDQKKNILFVSYMITTTSPEHEIHKSKTRQEYKNLLKSYMIKRTNIIFFHKNFLYSMKPSKSFAFEFYQSGNYQSINKFMRSGEFEVELWTMMDSGKLDKLFAFEAFHLKSKTQMEKLENSKMKEFKIFYDKFLQEQKEYVGKIEKSISILKSIIQNAPRHKNQTRFLYFQRYQHVPK